MSCKQSLFCLADCTVKNGCQNTVFAKFLRSKKVLRKISNFNYSRSILYQFIENFPTKWGDFFLCSKVDDIQKKKKTSKVFEKYFRQQKCFFFRIFLNIQTFYVKELRSPIKTLKKLFYILFLTFFSFYLFKLI